MGVGRRASKNSTSVRREHPKSNNMVFLWFASNTKTETIFRFTHALNLKHRSAH